MKPNTADILTQTTLSQGDENKLNFLRQRWGIGGAKKPKDDDKRDKDDDDEDVPEDLTQRLIPPRDQRVNDLILSFRSFVGYPEDHSFRSRRQRRRCVVAVGWTSRTTTAT